ncbi:phosphonate ABC transporter, permease protein PhnE [Ignavigranum ruoffiae]|uniref:phosphonate ABC transporter, permease protein PhnE n=1 Tax=Ignavigranum ruoffiae TaxID=89093 RepID=UPI0023568E67|nr:phosphonate ABC transporter, permease protein PhnE [Ignavigranum ruoffiae]
MSWKKFGLSIIFISVLVLAFMRIDFSNMTLVHWRDLQHIVSGLMQPEWTYLYDGSQEDLLSLMIETINIAFFGTVLGSVLAFPLALLASKRIIGRKLQSLSSVIKGFFAFLRAIPALIYGILFVRIVGPGPFAGALALSIQVVGMVGKLVAEACDQIEGQPIEAFEASGASVWQVFQYAKLPQIMAKTFTYILTHFEINVRSATVLGLVGAGGIGAPIIFALQQRDWSKVSIILLSIIVVVLLIDYLNAILRHKLK